jgi:hypothetical protein
MGCCLGSITLHLFLMQVIMFMPLRLIAIDAKNETKLLVNINKYIVQL